MRICWLLGCAIVSLTSAGCSVATGSVQGGQDLIANSMATATSTGTATGGDGGDSADGSGGGAMTNNTSADCQAGGMYGGNTWTDLYQCYFGPTGPDSCAGTAGSCHGTGGAGTTYWTCGETSDTCYMGMAGFALIDPTGSTSNPTSNGLYTTLCVVGPNNQGFMPLGCQPSSVLLYPADMARIAAWIQAGGMEN